MIIDSSALLAILLQEPEAEIIARAIDQDDHPMMSAATLLETSMVIEARKKELGAMALDEIVREYEIEIGPFTEKQAQLARQAFRDFGKGRHPAGLNFGDCIAYALARDAGEPLLYKGNDFSHTDIEAVVLPGEKNQ